MFLLTKNESRQNADNVLRVLPLSEKAWSGLQCVCSVPVSTGLRMHRYLLVAETFPTSLSVVYVRSVLAHITLYVNLKGHSNVSCVLFFKEWRMAAQTSVWTLSVSCWCLSIICRSFPSNSYTLSVDGQVLPILDLFITCYNQRTDI